MVKLISLLENTKDRAGPGRIRDAWTNKVPLKGWKKLPNLDDELMFTSRVFLLGVILHTPTPPRPTFSQIQSLTIRRPKNFTEFGNVNRRIRRLWNCARVCRDARLPLSTHSFTCVHMFPVIFTQRRTLNTSHSGWLLKGNAQKKGKSINSERRMGNS